jgi:hypothetical protein
MSDELAYHARELQADLRIVEAGGGDDRAWVQAAALLEHDLEVHVAALIDATPLPAPGADFRAHVAAALAALHDDRVVDAAAAIAAAHVIAARAVSRLR